MSDLFDTHKTISDRINAPRPALLPPMTSPLIQPEYVFCRDAIEVAGKAMFGDQWNAEEQKAVFWPTSPETIWASEWQNYLARPLYQRPSLPPSIAGKAYRGEKGETDDEFAARKIKHREDCNEKLSNVPEHISKLQVLWKANHDATNRLMDVLQWLGGKCRSGEIQGAYVFKAGHKVFLLEKDHWNGVSDLERWARDGGFPIYVNNASYPTHAFMVRADLEREMRTLAHSKCIVSESDLSRLPPYLKFAVNLAVAQGWFVDGTIDTTAVREAEIAAHWDNAFPDIKLSKDTKEAIAKVLGNPNAKAVNRSVQASAKAGKR